MFCVKCPMQATTKAGFVHPRDWSFGSYNRKRVAWELPMSSTEEWVFSKPGVTEVTRGSDRRHSSGHAIPREWTWQSKINGWLAQIR